MLREGYTTGSCAAAACLAVALWKTTGECPARVCIDTPIGKTLQLDVVRLENMRCGVVKDAGDDPDVTDKCMVVADVTIWKNEGDIIFHRGEGVGVVAAKGLKVSVGEPAINPVPRMMIEKELRKVIGNKGADVTISIPHGEEIAKKTFNPRLGIVGGLSILGTTGIVRPMSDEAVKESLALELHMHKESGKKSVALVPGNTGEKALKKLFPKVDCIVHMSNYVGFMMDTAIEYGFKNILIFGQTGKLVKLAADIMNTHSHIADARNEVICTHAALMGARIDILRQLYECKTTQASIEIINSCGMSGVWQSIIEKAKDNCEKRVLKKAEIGLIFVDDKHNVLAMTKNAESILEGFFYE
ncbi:MAG: cobalt-precorrin-5B (C(1))-methyltransferase CbiD [Clostridia bacterium]|nr:cobalt-precorrin-5B (C(1))-methyltransferase CbiD [Clostridia bacterium]